MEPASGELRGCAAREFDRVRGRVEDPRIEQDAVVLVTVLDRAGGGERLFRGGVRLDDLKRAVVGEPRSSFGDDLRRDGGVIHAQLVAIGGRCAEAFSGGLGMGTKDERDQHAEGEGFLHEGILMQRTLYGLDMFDGNSTGRAVLHIGLWRPEIAA